MELIRPYVAKRFVEIEAVKQIREAIEYARAFDYPAYVISPPGYGKTTALWHLADEYKGFYCQIGAAQKSVSEMYRTLLSTFKILHNSTYQRDLFNVLVDSLLRESYYMSEPDDKPLLIVDEFQTLEAQAKRELLNIQETCGLALVIAGNAERLVAENKRDTAAMEQIESRIGMRVTLPPLTEQDCIGIGAAMNVEGRDAYEAVESFGLQTNVRALVQMLQQADRLSGGGAGVRLQHIKSAVLSMHGKADALSYLKTPKS